MILCFGICCPVHAQCTRYLDVDGATSGEFIGTCLTNGQRPMFILHKVG
jgi:hypothetical protein